MPMELPLVLGRTSSGFLAFIGVIGGNVFFLVVQTMTGH